MRYGERTEHWLSRMGEGGLTADVLKDLRDLEEENRDLKTTLRAEIRKGKQRPYFLLTYVLASLWMPVWALGQRGLPGWIGVIFILGGLFGAVLSLSHAMALNVSDDEVALKVRQRFNNPW